MEGTNYVTKDGLEKLKAELAHSETEGRKKVSDDLEEALAMGDLSENAAYQEAKERQSHLEGRILELRHLIHNAVVITDDFKQKGVVQLGSKIVVKNGDGKKEFTIVGSNEADPINGLISNESPLGRAFLGKNVKDTVKVNAPKGIIEYKILKVE